MECCTISQNIHWPGLEISETARVKLEFLYCSGHVSSRADLNAPLGQLLEPISSSENRDVKPGLERKSSRLGISDIVIIIIDPTNCILWKSKVTSYCAEFHKCVKYFTLWFLCRNWCVSPRQTSFYDKVNLCPIELNSTSKWNILHIGFFVEIYVYHHGLGVSSTSVFDNLVLSEHINMVVVTVTVTNEASEIVDNFLTMTTTKQSNRTAPCLCKGKL